MNSNICILMIGKKLTSNISHMDKAPIIFFKLGISSDVTEVSSTPDKLLKDLQTAVGGYIERVYIQGEFDKYYLMVNEEGLLEHEPKLNILASSIVNQPIHGDAALILKKDFT